MTEESDGNPVARTEALISEQGAHWGDYAQSLPTSGNAGEHCIASMVAVVVYPDLQSFDLLAPDTYPALIRRDSGARRCGAVASAHRSYDAYKILSPFTGEP